MSRNRNSYWLKKVHYIWNLLNLGRYKMKYLIYHKTTFEIRTKPISFNPSRVHGNIAQNHYGRSALLPHGSSLPPGLAGATGRFSRSPGVDVAATHSGLATTRHISRHFEKKNAFSNFNRIPNLWQWHSKGSECVIWQKWQFSVDVFRIARLFVRTFHVVLELCSCCLFEWKLK